MIDEIERYRQWRRRKDRKWAEAVFPRQWLQQYQLHHDWYRGRILYFLGAKEHRERDKQMRIRNLMAAGYAGTFAPNPFLTESTKLICLRHRDKRYKRLIRNKETLHRYKRWMRQMSKGSKQIYLITGTEGGWKWRLSFSVSQKQRKWQGSFDFTKTKKLHTQKTIYLTGGAVKGCEWQLNTNVSDKGQLEANFYFKAGKACTPTLDPSPKWGRDRERVRSIMFAKPKQLIPLRHRDKRWKVLNERKERYHRYKVQSVFSEYYETDQIGISPYIEDESFLPKRKPKRKREREI